MFLRLMRADRLKLKRSPVWLAFLLMPIVPAILGTINYKVNVDILQSEWYSLWTQHTLFTCYFFLPIMLGIYCSYLMRLEHNNHNWNKLLTMPVHIYQVFLSKLVISSGMVLLSEVWIGFLFIISGNIAGITSPVPLGLIAWLLCGALGGVVIVSIQLLLSIAIKSFALPIGVVLAGGISALIALVKGIGHIYPYALMAYGMEANSPQELASGGYLQFVLVCILYIAFFSIIGSAWLSKKDM